MSVINRVGSSGGKTCGLLSFQYGTVVSQDKIASGTGVDVFGLAIPDLTKVGKVKAALVIYDGNVESDSFSET